MTLPPLQYETITNYAPAIRGSGNQETVDGQSVEIVRAWTGVRVTPALSSHNGRPAVRLIPNSASNADSYIRFDMPVELNASGTFRATLIREGPITGTVNSSVFGTIVVTSPKHSSSVAQNEIGTYDLRVDYNDLTSSPARMQLYHGGLLGSGDVTFVDIGLFSVPYDGRIFDGDTPPFMYRDQMVYPMWDGVPGESTSSFNFYNYTKTSPKLNWSDLTNHYYEHGVDRGVLYVKNSFGVAWHGLISITEQSNLSAPTASFIDGTKFNQTLKHSDFSATLSAYSAPEEFSKCDGVDAISNGLFVTEQKRVGFDLAYRTQIGSAANADENHYKLHLVYNCVATKDDITHTTISDSPSPITHGWSIHTVPVLIPGKRAAAHIVVDSRYTPFYILKSLEDVLYGSPVNEPTMPSMQDVITLFSIEAGE